MRLVAVLVLASFLAASPATALDTPVATRDSLRLYLDGLAAFGFTGQIVVAEGDSIVAEIAAGRTGADGPPVTPATCFAGGSIAKSFTAAMIVRLAQRGRLSLDDSLAKHLDDVPRDKQDITLRQLLMHRSGLAENGDDTREDDTRDAVVRKILGTPTVAAPDAKFSYSNAGFELLAAVVERVTQRPYADVVLEELIRPAGMSGSGTGSAAAARCAETATGRNEWRWLGTPHDWRQVWAGTGAGDLVTNARELTRWGRAMQGAGPLSKTELDTLLFPRTPVGRGDYYYGFGVWVVPVRGGVPMVSIGGDIPGFHAVAYVERQTPWRITTVMLSGEHFGRSLAVTTIQQALWAILRGDSPSFPPATVPWPFAATTAIAGTWTLPGNSRLELTPDGDGLRLGITGTAAIDLALGADTTGARDEVEARALQIVEAAAQEHEAVLGNALHPVEYELWARPLRAAMAERVTQFGQLRDVSVLGTMRLPWLDNGQRTYLRLEFARAVTDMSLAWLDRGLLDVTFGEGRPHPLLLPVAPLAEGGLAAWNLLDGSSLKLEPFRDKKGAAILITGPGGQAIARRARKK